ncbi:MAG: histidine phosphatase family protein [Bacteroidota bacterium]
MELLIIRHGQSEADLLQCHEGRADFPLTDLGKKQAALLAEWLVENFPPDYIVSSPLQRAKQTAEIVGERAGLKVQYFEELMEFNNGLLAGLPYDEAERKYPLKVGKKPHERLYGQESTIDFRARAESIFSKITFEFPADKRIAIVSHGGMINMLFRAFLNLSVISDVSIINGDTAVHLWEVDGEKREVIFMGKDEHLKGF